MTRPSKFKISLIILVVGLLVILNLTPALKEIKNFFYLISLPVQKAFWQIGGRAADFLEALSELKNLKKENEELKLKIKELSAENTALKELKAENETLRKALKVGLEKEFKLALAQVIAKDISQDLLIIDKGSADGISPGLPVITEEKILVGRTYEVYQDFSKIQLASHQESSFDAKIAETKIFGLVKGKGNFKISFELVPQEAEIKKEDLLVTTSLGGIFPQGLLIGRLQEIKKSDVEAFQKAEVEPAFDLQESESLFIITNF